MDGVGSLFLCGVNYVGVYLCGLYIGMPKHGLDGVYVCSKLQLERSIRMPEAVESDMLLNASSFYPFFQWF